MFAEEWRDERDYVVAHTSGSTGTPKPIRLKKSDMELSARATADFFHIDAGSLLALPLAEEYIAGKMMVVRAIITGAELIEEPPSRTPLARKLPRRVDLAAIVPQQIKGLAESPCEIRNVIVGGAPVSPALEHYALDTRPDIRWWGTYGMTETCSHVALRAFGTDLFEALPAVSFSTDERGCLAIKHEKASWSPLTTNDMVDLCTPTSFRWLGRHDNVIISGGLKIHPEEVERILSLSVSGIRFYVTGRPSEAWGQESVLVVEGEPSAETERRFREAFAALPSFKRPKEIIYKEAFCFTKSGKIKRDGVV